MPQAKHGGSGVCIVAVEGSKFDGTGLENVHMGQIQVALLAAVGSAGGRWKGLSVRVVGEDVALREGEFKAVTLFWADILLEGLGTRVTFGEDLRNPAYLGSQPLSVTSIVPYAAHIEFKPLNLLQVYSYRVLSRLLIVHIVDPMGRQVDMSILVIWYFIFPETENKCP